MEAKKAIFIDKDGTLIKDVPYNVNPDKISISDDAIKGLKNLVDAGYRLIVISNQSGVAMGLFQLSELSGVEKKMNWLLRKHGIHLTGFYYCPHYPEGTLKEFSIECGCHKPKNGLILKAARQHQINLSQSWMIGDILDDVQAGNLSGCKTILIDNGHETIWEMNNSRIPDYLAANINEAADYILKFTPLMKTEVLNNN